MVKGTDEIVQGVWHEERWNEGIGGRVSKRRRVGSEEGERGGNKRLKREVGEEIEGGKREAEVLGEKDAKEGTDEDERHDLESQDREQQLDLEDDQQRTRHEDRHGTEVQEIQQLFGLDNSDEQRYREWKDTALDSASLGAMPSSRRAIHGESGGPEHVGDYDEWFRRQGMPLLKLLANQILEFIARCRLSELENYQSDKSFEEWRKLNGLFEMFEQAKSIYGLIDEHGSNFIHCETPLQEDEGGKSLEKINLATAIIILLQGPDFCLEDLRENYFIRIFMRSEAEFEVWQANLLGDLTLYCYLNGEMPVYIPESDDPYAQARLLETRLKENDLSRTLSRAEGALIGRCLKIGDAERRGGKNYYFRALDWTQTIHECLPYLKQFVQRTMEMPVSKFDFAAEPPILESTEDVEPSDIPIVVLEQPASEEKDDAEEPQVQTEDTFDQDEMIRRAALAAHAALTGQPIPESYDSPISYNDYPSQIQQQHPSFQPIHQSPYAQNAYAQELQARAASAAAVAAQQQNPTTAEQYERARLAATAKAAKNKSNTPTPSQRRPWTQEEENALMTGLDRVQGPHWSQILAMYGAGGTISDILKDRNQVQLKDKARNLKLFFLKSGLEVPHYLKHVTGELKTRAPITAAKNEARERLQESSGEDRATDNAISLLAGGRQGFATASPQSERAMSVPGIQGFEHAGGGSPSVGMYGRLYQQQMEEQEEDEDDGEDEMMADAIQQALAVGQQTAM